MHGVYEIGELEMRQGYGVGDIVAGEVAQMQLWTAEGRSSRAEQAKAGHICARPRA